MTGRGGKRSFSEAFEDQRRQCVPTDMENRDSQQLWQENKRLRRGLSDIEKQNRKLQADLQWADEDIRRRDHDIRSLQRQLSALKAQRAEKLQSLEEENLRLKVLLSEMPDKKRKITPPPVQRRAIGPPSREPTVHQRTQRKLEDWRFHPKKSILIMGDSNLARVPEFSDANIQLDSYPGAQFYHLTEMLRGIPQTKWVETVVLSAGLNNCLRKQKIENMVQQLDALLEVAKGKFPNATFHIPIINFCDRLESKQKEQLVNLNTVIETNYDFLSGLDPVQFRTQPRDPVHWTPKTANLIIQHWLDQLNVS